MVYGKALPGRGEAGQGGVQHAAARSGAHRDLCLACTDHARLDWVVVSLHCGLRYTKKLTGSDFISNIKKVYLRNF